MNDPKNPVFVPNSGSQRRRGCPACDSPEFTGRRLSSGTVKFTCDNQKCRQTWSGGLPQVPMDPRLPTPPVDPKDRPTVSFEPFFDKNTKSIEYREEVRSPNPTQSFRQGAPVPSGEE